jgi:hypothetical protein
MKTIKDAMNLQGRISAHFAGIEEQIGSSEITLMAEFSRLFRSLHLAICRDSGATWEEVTKLNWETTQLGPEAKEVCLRIEKLWAYYENL